MCIELVYVQALCEESGDPEVQMKKYLATQCLNSRDLTFGWL
jgi:hypothetical protein